MLARSRSYAGRPPRTPNSRLVTTRYATSPRLTTNASTRSQVIFSVSSYTSSGRNSDVATTARYSPQRCSDHSPTPSATWSAPYANRATATQVSVDGWAPSRLWTLATVGLCSRSMLSTSASGLAAGRICANSCCSEVWAFSNRRTATPSRTSTSALSHRSTANRRSTVASRRARPRSTMGAWSAGPLPAGSPGTKSPHRRQRQASPAGVPARRRAASASSSGAYVACPRRAQPRRFQSTAEACPVVEVFNGTTAGASTCGAPAARGQGG